MPLVVRFLLKRPVLLREASYGKAAYELQESLREATGRVFLPERGGNFRPCAVDQKRPFFSYSWAVSGPSAL